MIKGRTGVHIPPRSHRLSYPFLLTRVTSVNVHLAETNQLRLQIKSCFNWLKDSKQQPNLLQQTNSWPYSSREEPTIFLGMQASPHKELGRFFCVHILMYSCESLPIFSWLGLESFSGSLEREGGSLHLSSLLLCVN